MPLYAEISEHMCIIINDLYKYLEKHNVDVEWDSAASLVARGRDWVRDLIYVYPHLQHIIVYQDEKEVRIPLADPDYREKVLWEVTRYV